MRQRVFQTSPYARSTLCVRATGENRRDPPARQTCNKNATVAGRFSISTEALCAPFRAKTRLEARDSSHMRYCGTESSNTICDPGRSSYHRCFFVRDVVTSFAFGESWTATGED